MVRKATVKEQRPSVAKRGSYLTILDDGFGELRAYCTRQLSQNDTVYVSVQQGMNRDPLSVTILNKRQQEVYLRDHPEDA